MFTCGAFFGAGFAGPSGDYFGRRRTISLGCLFFCLGGGLQTGARTLAFLYSGRFFAGFGYVFLPFFRFIPIRTKEMLKIAPESGSLPW